jgi:cytochrome b
MAEKRLVWDIPTRLFHWLLVLSLIGSYLTAKPGELAMQWHFRIGYFTIGLLVFRILWGFVGPRHARFLSFAPTPGRLFGYSVKLFDRNSAPAVGHNPLGGLAVLVMLVMVSLQATTGLFISDDIVWSGPWNPAVSGATASKLAGIHHQNFDLLLWVVGLHVFTIIFYAAWKRQNLVTPMLSGYKQASVVPAGEEIANSQLLKALVIAVISAAVVYAVLAFAPPPPVDEYYY